ncbi:uncharacterized protein LOC134278427 [Saccostrea cucullata]|uniref:uncharacterized protein LOC134278427 n=1 Tax=Saccostrea cuccullata TaxID=36930 RepID=UPI002ED3A09A
MNWFNVLITINLSLATIEVQRCPSNGESWKLSSDRIGCNKTHPYHCLPNNNLTSYVELCYKHTFFIEGGCLKYLDSGYIDQVKCAEFVCGCPDKSYYGDELFQYPMCLDLFIPGSCFTAHIDCLKLRVKALTVRTT